MSGSEEVELKLQLGHDAIATLLTDPIFTAHDPSTRDQLSTYFDTDKRHLNAAGLSLRIRASGGKRVQTIKTESKAAASLFARGEWEREVTSDTPDLVGAPPVLTDIVSNKRVKKLAPAFTVEIQRTTVVHEDGANRIELVADQGQAVAGERTCPITEIELELLDGDRKAIFSLARELGDRVPLRLGVQTKSERGYTLLAGKQTLSVKAEPITLSRDTDTAALFEAVAGACIRQFRLNEDRLLASGAPAPLHQARVALRRLRSALSTFRPMLEGPELDRFQAEFRALAAALGRVRDVDVMIQRIEHEPALDRLRAARQHRFDAVQETLNSKPVRCLMLDFVEWLSVGEWREREDTADQREMPALVTSAQMLDRLRRKLRRRGKHLATLNEHDRHRVRIAGKKLRYTAEFFVDLYRRKKSVHRREAYFEASEDLQTALGHLNDLSSGRALFDELGIDDAEAILSAGKQADTKRLLSRAEQAHGRLIEAKPFWR